MTETHGGLMIILGESIGEFGLASLAYWSSFCYYVKVSANDSSFE